MKKKTETLKDCTVTFTYKVDEEQPPMKILTPEKMAEHLDFRRPLHPSERTKTMWPIPFEYGANEKGTRISVAKARVIAAELRAEVAEEEKRELFDAFQAEQRRAAEARKNTRVAEDKWIAAMAEVAVLKTKLGALKKRLRAKS